MLFVCSSYLSRQIILKSSISNSLFTCFNGQVRGVDYEKKATLNSLFGQIYYMKKRYDIALPFFLKVCYCCCCVRKLEN